MNLFTPLRSSQPNPPGENIEVIEPTGNVDSVASLSGSVGATNYGSVVEPAVYWPGELSPLIYTFQSRFYEVLNNILSPLVYTFPSRFF